MSILLQRSSHTNLTRGTLYNLQEPQADGTVISEWHLDLGPALITNQTPALLLVLWKEWDNISNTSSPSTINFISLPRCNPISRHSASNSHLEGLFPRSAQLTLPPLSGDESIGRITKLPGS